jgi:hypothetical protein
MIFSGLWVLDTITPSYRLPSEDPYGPRALQVSRLRLCIAYALCTGASARPYVAKLSYESSVKSRLAFLRHMRGRI